MADATTITSAPDSPYENVGRRFPSTDADRLGRLLWSTLQGTRGDREILEANLSAYDDLYEMRIAEKNYPWPGCANLFVPLIPTQVDTLVSQLAAAVFVPRLFLVNGNTPEASQVEHEVEAFYNAESFRYGWIDSFYRWLHLSILHGNGIMKVVWNRSVRTTRMNVEEPVLDDQGVPLLNDDGTPQTSLVPHERETVEHDDVILEPIELRDFLIAPAWQKDIEKATAVACAEMISEPDLMAMVDSGQLWKDAVERALDYVSEGHSDAALEDNRSSYGDSRYSAGGQIEVGSELTGMGDDRYHTVRGPLRVWMVFTRQFSRRGEETVFWVAENSQICLGSMPAKYWHGKRPFVNLALMPRPASFYGYAVPERLRTIQSEINAISNQRTDAIDIRISPPMYEFSTVTDQNEGKTWGPAERYTVQGAQDIGIFNLPEIPQSAWQQESMLLGLADKLTGLSSPTMGQPNTGRRSAREIQTMSSATTVRLNLMAARLRMAVREVFHQIHALKMQYGPDQVQAYAPGSARKFQIDKQKLGQDFQLDIAGSGGPLDTQNRQQQMFFVYGLMMQNPDISQDPVKRYRALRLLLEEYNLTDIQGLIGTEQEAMQRGQAQAQEAQQQKQMADQEHALDLQHRMMHPEEKPPARPKPPAQGHPQHQKPPQQMKPPGR